MELSIKDIKELLGARETDVRSEDGSLKKGKYLFRTVTMIYTGELIRETSEFFVLKKAAWIADTGRWADNLVSCEFSEVEPYPAEKEVYVYKSGMLDIVEIDKLPLKQK